ncbi:MAG: GNAT family N-acetyltransferase [Hyphomicrobiaceae bacterium]|nr:GNAT family N-acetyltransferase [Hyphomicrobiaceae bacterium]
MRVEAERIYLRPLTVADCSADYVGWLNDPEVSRFLETRHSEQTQASVEGFVSAVNARPNEHLFGIFLRDGDRHIGNIKVGPVGSYHPVGDVSLLIGARDCWGKGFASEAIAAVSRHALGHLGAKKLSASMYEPNQGSCKAFLKAGYKQEGLRRQHYMLDGALCDVIELGLTPEDIA